MITVYQEKISIQRYKRILRVDENEILIAMKHSNVSVFGETLLIIYLNAEEIIVRGKIKKVEFFCDTRT